MKKSFTFISAILVNAIYSLLLEVYWLAYYGVLYASGSIVFADSTRKFLWSLTPFFVALIAVLGVFINVIFFKRLRKNGNNEKLWSILLTINIIILLAPAIIGLADGIDILINENEIYCKML